MATEFKLPEIGEGTAEGEIVKWLVAEGDRVEEDTPLVEVMTDKATVEIPSPQAGRIASLHASEGEVVEVGAVILVFGEEGEVVDPADGDANGEAGSDGTTEPAAGEDAVAAARAMARAELEDMEPAGEPKHPWEAPAPAAGRALATPATRRMARELGVGLGDIAGTGKGGRVMKHDVEEAARAAPPAAAPSATATDEAPTTPETPGEAPEPPAAPTPVRRPAGTGEKREERTPFLGLRRKIAQRMVEAKRNVPHFTYVEECDMTEIVALRERAKEIGAREGIKVTYLPFIVKALIAAARRHPIVNSALDEEAGEIVVKGYFNVGIATATERGLMVPVVKSAEQLSVFELAREIERVSADARAGKSQLEDLQDGTITITSTGNIGGVLATPILNVPEVAILGVTAIRKRPVVRDGEIVIRDMLNLSISLDHRIVDGADGALFMRDMIAYLEDPKLLLLGSL